MKALVLILTLLIAFSNYQQDARGQEKRRHSQRAKEALDSAIELLKKELSGGNNPHFPDAEKLFRKAVQEGPESDEGTTAFVWIAAFDLEKVQSNVDLKKITDGTKGIRERLKTHFKNDTSSWQPKVAKLLSVATLFLDKNWPELELGVNDILKNIDSYKNEKDPMFEDFWRIRGSRLSDLEPEYAYLLVMANAFQGHLDLAIQKAKAIEKQFPDWSKRGGVDGHIELMETGQVPWKL